MKPVARAKRRKPPRKRRRPASETKAKSAAKSGEDRAQTASETRRKTLADRRSRRSPPPDRRPRHRQSRSERSRAPQGGGAEQSAAPRPPPSLHQGRSQIGRDWSETLFLPKTDFPMKAGLPEREPELLKRWERLRLYDRLREEAMGREKFVLHDGPPYANGHIHIGTGLNKILKDVVTRSQSMMGKDANYVPGWDCHGLPIEWKIEEENYRAKGKTKPDLSDPAAMIAFRRECRAYASIGSTCSARSSSAWASRATGSIPTPP